MEELGKPDDTGKGLGGDFLTFLMLKANDLEIAPDDKKLAEHCHAAFYCIHCAAVAIMAVFLSAEPSNRIWFVIHNLTQRLRGLPGLPRPNGDPLDALKAVSPLLETLVDRCSSDLEIRRVLQRLETNECGSLPSGTWNEPTSHAAAVRFAQDVLHDIWMPVIGIAGMASSSRTNMPRFDETTILPKHRGVIRRSLQKYQDIELMGLMRGINAEVARALKSRGGQQRTTILFLAADPSAVKPAEHLRLDEEVRAIEAEIRASMNRDQLDLRSAWAVRASDLSRELQFRAPEIVHFGCHGDFEELELEGAASKPHAVTHDAVARLFRTFKDVRLVFLNVCNSAGLAKELVAHVDSAIGMDGSITDDSAILFAGAVYRALASGRSVKEAFELGKAELTLHGGRDVELPILCFKKDVDTESLVFTGVRTQAPSSGGQESMT
jgi:hypothetical protein